MSEAVRTQTAALHPDLQRVSDAIEKAVAGMSPDQLAWSPQGKWSAANILEHLSITYGGTARAFNKVVSKGASLATRQTTYQKMATFVVTGLLFLPGGRKAPEMTVPSGLGAEAALAAARTRLLEMNAAMAAAEPVASGKIADHPVLGALTLKQWRRFHVAHSLHHMKQIQALRESLRAQ